ncbi:MAG: hypothetical protein D6797_08140 [Bdellovibrio sp.]|nr:MAG: hypothetical protein D6797_08140 [Bdellovibrio sp.]
MFVLIICTFFAFAEQNIAVGNIGSFHIPVTKINKINITNKNKISNINQTADTKVNETNSTNNESKLKTIEQSDTNKVNNDFTNVNPDGEIAIPIPDIKKNFPPKILKLPIIRLNNFIPEFKLNLSQYVKDKNNKPSELKWKIEANENVNVEIKDEIAYFSVSPTYQYVAEWVKLRVTDPFGASDSSDIRVTYINITNTTPPSQGMPETYLYQDSAYEEGRATAGSRSVFTYHLKAGWNLISLALIPDNHHVEQLFSSLDGFYTAVYAFAYNRYQNEWKIYIPGAPSDINTLDWVDESMGIWIYMTEDHDFVLNGNTILNTEIKLGDGWNLISFPSNVNLSFNDTLRVLNETFDLVYEYDPTYPPDYWRVYNKYWPEILNDLNTLQAGFGYWVHTNYPMTWEYDSSEQKYKLLEVDNNQQYNNKSFVYMDSQLLAQVDKDGNIFYYHTDYLGSGRIMTNSSGDIIWTQTNYPFGGQVKGTGQGNSFKFSGREYDYTTKLYDFGSRYLDPEIGRFISADDHNGKIENPQTLNRYVYSGNNPLKYVDPSGNQFNPFWVELYFKTINWLRETKTSTFFVTKNLERAGKINRVQRVLVDECVNAACTNAENMLTGNVDVQDVKVGPAAGVGSDNLLVGADVKITYGLLSGGVDGSIGGGVAGAQASIGGGYSPGEGWHGGVSAGLSNGFLGMSSNGESISLEVTPGVQIPGVCEVGICVGVDIVTPPVEPVHNLEPLWWTRPSPDLYYGFLFPQLPQAPQSSGQ